MTFASGVTPGAVILVCPQLVPGARREGHTERISVVVRWDSNGDGVTGESDDPPSDAKVTLTGPSLDFGASYSGLAR